MGLFGGQVVDWRPGDPRFPPHWQQGFFFLFRVHSSLTPSILSCEAPRRLLYKYTRNLGVLSWPARLLVAQERLWKYQTSNSQNCQNVFFLPRMGQLNTDWTFFNGFCMKQQHFIGPLFAILLTLHVITFLMLFITCVIYMAHIVTHIIKTLLKEVEITMCKN